MKQRLAEMGCWGFLETLNPLFQGSMECPDSAKYQARSFVELKAVSPLLLERRGKEKSLRLEIPQIL